MLDRLKDRIGAVIKSLNGKQHISEKNIRDVVEQIKLSLLDADVNLRIVRRFVNHTIEHATGEQVLRGVNPGEQFTKIIYDKIVELLGGQSAELNIQNSFSTILLAGLQGSGKTTTAAKLARYLRHQGKRVLLVSLDYSRPAAAEQLQQLAERVDIDFYSAKEATSIKAKAKDVLQYAKRNNYQSLIVDTAGRMHIEEEAMKEVKDISEYLTPAETLFVADAMTGQVAADTAKTFNEYISLSGIILSKFDSDTRGGAAMSVVSVTGCPIKLIGTGEHPEDLEQFHPDRIASRILGMGDVVSLVEKAQATINEEDAEKLRKKIEKTQFNLEDYLEQSAMLTKVGSIQQLKEMIPGLTSVDSDQVGERLSKERALIQSMTVEERRNPRIIGLSRRRRISKGSGNTMFEINNFLKRFDKMKIMMKKMSKKNAILA